MFPDFKSPPPFDRDHPFVGLRCTVSVVTSDEDLAVPVKFEDRHGVVVSVSGRIAMILCDDGEVAVGQVTKVYEHEKARAAIAKIGVNLPS